MIRNSIINSATKHIINEFDNVLAALWQRYVASNKNAKPRIALAVSGGVDSIALAFLCHNLKYGSSSGYFTNFDFGAFVVDHKARAESEKEAIRTQRRLLSLGIPSKVLSLTGFCQGLGNSPGGLSNFETQARHLRYQALGKACAQDDYSVLLLAHHSDDQAETIIHRIATGHSGISLNPIKSIAKIPECWGIPGVGSSASNNYSPSSTEISQEESSNASADAYLNAWYRNQSFFETSDVTLIRPLLSFDKTNLIQLCQDNSIQWEEDHSNKDVTLTPRNSIRQLLANDQPPVALRKPSLLQVARYAEVKYMHIRSNSDAFFLEIDIWKLDLRSGSLIIFIPTSVSRQLASENDSPHSSRTAAYLLHCLMSPITPFPDVALKTLENAVDNVLMPFGSSSQCVMDSQKPVSLTVGGVRFELLSEPHRTMTDVPFRGSENLEKAKREGTTWLLSRQPAKTDAFTFVVSPNLQQDETSKIGLPSTTSNLQDWSTSHLLDGRYWIRFRFSLHHPEYSTNENVRRPRPILFIRFLQESDLSILRTQLRPQRFARLRKLIQTCAPAKVRWTLPVMVEVVGGREAWRVVALPTLGKEGIFDHDDKTGDLSSLNEDKRLNHADVILDHDRVREWSSAVMTESESDYQSLPNTRNAKTGTRKESHVNPIFRAALSEGQGFVEWSIKYKDLGTTWMNRVAQMERDEGRDGRPGREEGEDPETGNRETSQNTFLTWLN